MTEGLLQTARAVAEAALATKGVHALGSGRYAEAATYGAGEKVLGVVVNDGEVEVHVIASYPLEKPIPELAKDIESNVGSKSGGRSTTVVFEDLALGDTGV